MAVTLSPTPGCATPENAWPSGGRTAGNTAGGTVTATINCDASGRTQADELLPNDHDVFWKSRIDLCCL